jgi:transposase InsO family protein
MDWYFTHGKNAEGTCRHFSLSKSVFYLWLNRFDKYNLTSLEFNFQSRRPKKVRAMTTPQNVLDRIHDIRKSDLEKSKYEIHEELLREGVKVINRNPELHNVQQTKLKSHRKMQIARIRAAKELREKELGSLVQVDTKHLYILGDRYYLFAAVDCKSRYGYVWAYANISSASAADFLFRVTKAFPFPIQAINTDNGSEYLLHFHQASQSLGLSHYFSYPHTPKMNGRVERFISTVTHEFFDWQDDLIPGLKNINLKCQIFNQKYVYQRYHKALGYKTPDEYVKTHLSEKGATVLYV